MNSTQSRQTDRHTIWSDINLDLEDWRADLKAEYPELTEDECITRCAKLMPITLMMKE